ncbi:cobalamin-binding protein [Planobispora rosea]|uniref:Cobalamin-binding protein n=1 Tax=Planobispora rosea TaxID=35762 RepID=A0A8J3WDG8_PLARO|nr:cobalamin B12-binding domain-containing protein [Planobispora rosea]GGS72798.1 cobalamin-binding protein [Planobispora rosea]GIH85325.1 cobalamin-binding protein [Planobispora rosea]
MTPISETVIDRYLKLAGLADEYGAIDLALELLGRGVPAEAVLLDLVAPAQARVGELWAADEWSVAREHAATAVSDRVVAAVAAHARPRPTRERIIVTCPDGEYHALPARLLAEVLRLRGWQVDFLGASVPDAHLITYLHQTGPEAVALSCTLPTRLPRAHATLTACRSVGVPVLAGGRGFGPGGHRAFLLGADAWAPSARPAADRLDRGLPSFPPQPPVMKHLADEEYTSLAGRRGDLLARVMRALGAAYPPMASYDVRQLEATAEDLAHYADFLAAALYVDDSTLFTDFVTWTAGVLRARGVPAGAVRAALDVFAGELREFPRARRFLSEAAAALTCPA